MPPRSDLLSCETVALIIEPAAVATKAAVTNAGATPAQVGTEVRSWLLNGLYIANLHRSRVSWQVVLYLTCALARISAGQAVNQ